MERRTYAYLLAGALLLTALVLAVIGIARWDGTSPWISADAELGPLPDFEKPQMKLDTATMDASAETDADATVTAQFESAASSVCTDEADSIVDARDADAE